MGLGAGRAERLQERLSSPIAGWMGHSDPFAFEGTYRPAPGISRFLSGTPSILSLAALDFGLDTFADAGMPLVDAKSRALTGPMIKAVEARCNAELRLASPSQPAQRGSHVSFAHAHAYEWSRR